MIKSTFLKKSFCIAGLALASSVSNAGMMTTWADNGHDYMLVQGNQTWEQANNSLADGWYLATITSAEEQSFIETAFGSFRGEYWLGGYQSEAGMTQSERRAGAADNWAWVTGEDWDYQNWKVGEPNEWRGTLENHLGIWNNGRNWNWDWNDEHGRANIAGYIAEKGSVNVSEPGSLALIGLGIAGLLASRKRAAA